MKKNSKVCIMGIYMGKLPNYFSVWLKSCENNPSVDFIVITDQSIKNVPENVKIINMTLKQVRARVSEKIGFKAKIDSPFKLCDYKPAYGFVFSDLFIGYDYWGHCDFDLIWGDLRSFFEKYNLEKYDKFLPMGHLSLYKNTKENNIKFMEKVVGYSDYKKIFTDERNYLFDELALIKIFNKNKNSFFDKIIYADIWPSKRRYTMCTDLKYYPSIYEEFRKEYNPVNFKNQIFMWEDKKIFQYYIENEVVKSREYIYIHIQKRKWDLEGEFSNKMIISKNKVFACVDENVKNNINKYNSYSFIKELYDDVDEFIKHCWSYTKRKILKIEKERIIVESKI